MNTRSIHELILPWGREDKVWRDGFTILKGEGLKKQGWGQERKHKI